MEENSSIYQVYLVSRIIGEGRVGFLWRGGQCLNRGERGVGGRGGEDGRESSIYLCVQTLNPSRGDKSDGFGKNAPVYRENVVSRTISEQRAECSRGWDGGGDELKQRHGCL